MLEDIATLNVEDELGPRLEVESAVDVPVDVTLSAMVGCVLESDDNDTWLLDLEDTNWDTQARSVHVETVELPVVLRLDKNDVVKKILEVDSGSV